MLPLLEFLADREERSNQEGINALAERFDLTDDELSVLIPSGSQLLFANRFAWAKSHMKIAGLISAPHRAHMKITDHGSALLAADPESISTKTLMTFPEYAEYITNRREKKKSKGETIVAPEDSSDLTPEEQLDDAYTTIREQLATELLEKVKAGTPQFFERLVVELLVAMGYGGSRRDAGKTVGRSGDGGIDGVTKEDRFGLEAIYLQAKRWEGTVGRPEIQKFAGALQGQRAKKGVFITTSSFTREAEDFANTIETKIVLIDGESLAGFMIDHSVGVSPSATYDIKRLDSDYFEEA